MSLFGVTSALKRSRSRDRLSLMRRTVMRSIVDCAIGRSIVGPADDPAHDSIG